MPDLSDLSHLTGGSAPTKADLRAARLAARRALPAGARVQADAALRSALVALVRARRPAVVAGYVPMPGEPGGAEFPAELAAALAAPATTLGRPATTLAAPATTLGGGPSRLLLPVVRPDSELDWAQYDGPQSLAPAAYGLHEPTGPRLGPEALAEVGLVVIPALAVDLRGVRLGRGRGHYDRALAYAGADAYLVAVVYDDDLLPLVPDEPHDRRVHAVITPSGGVRALC